MSNPIPPPAEFNPRDPGFVRDPYPVLRQMRARAPLYYWEQAHTWLLCRYDDVTAVLKDPRWSTSISDWAHYEHHRATSIPETLELGEHGLFQASPADHGRIRKVVRSAFTPSAATRREPMIREVVEQLLDEARLDERECFDVVTDLAEGMPIRVIGRMLGIPSEYDEGFRQWANALVKLVFPVLTPEERAAELARIPEGHKMMVSLIEQRRHAQGDDLISELIRAQVDGERLDQKELLALVGGLITGGAETTVHLLAFTVDNLLRFPDVLERVRAEPSCIPGLIEEVLRFDNFGALGTVRYAREEIELHGTTISKGSMMMCLLTSALHDESVWPDAERFDIDRSAVPSIAFGRGPHFCLGAYLARREVKVALEVLLERCPRLERAGEVRFAPHPVLRHMVSLPVRVRARGAQA